MRFLLMGIKTCHLSRSEYNLAASSWWNNYEFTFNEIQGT